MQDNYYLIQEWVGDAYVESGVYNYLKQFVIDYTKNIEKDGSVKVIKHDFSKSHSDTLRIIEAEKTIFTRIFSVRNIQLNIII